VSPMTWGVESNVVERFGAAGVPKENISGVKDVYTFTSPQSPASFLADFRTWYGPTMNAFAAAEQSGCGADLQAELEALFERENQSRSEGATVIPATFLRMTVTIPA
jgi:hypothetical protein